MARRLALLALMACAVAVRRPPIRPSDESNSESFDPFTLFDSYESFETTRQPRPQTNKNSEKVILRGKRPKVNMTVKNTKSVENKKYIKSTTINVESYANFVMTKRPPVIRPKPIVINAPHIDDTQEDEDYVWPEDENMVPVVKATTTRRPRTTTTRRPRTTTTNRPRLTTTTSKRSTRPTRPTTTTRPRTPKPTKKAQIKKVNCPPKKSEWLSEYFQETKLKRAPNPKPPKSGLLSRIYSWISKAPWFGGAGWFRKTKQKKPPPTTTTTTAPAPPPPPAATSNWFQILLDSEESDDGAYVAIETNKKPKKSQKKNYRGYQLLRAYPDTQWKVHEMLELEEDGQGSGLMWWTPPSLNGSTDLLVPGDLLLDVKDTLKSNNIEFDVVIWDLQKAIKYENPQLSKKQRLELEQLRGHPMTWRRYHRYADILRYLEYLQHSFADLVELVPLGRSSEGLPLVAVKISLPLNETHDKKASSKDKKWKLRSHMKPAVWLDGGAHAREWIAPAVATWILHTLVEGEKGLGAEYEVLSQADFYIMPVLNPDGYEHSHTHDRLWMKTRSRLSDQSDDYYVGWLPWNWGSSNCVGVDPDRNWDYHWGEQDSPRDPCADHYAGPHPFSEPETRAVSEFLAEHRGQIKVYVSLHAYSQAWLLPSSHANMPFADDGVLMEMGKLATAALADLYGTKYQIGTVAEIRQPAAGMSHDWAKARAGIKFAYHVDLRDSFGPHGFLLPGSQIVSTARETWQAVRAIVDNLNPV